MLPYLPCPALQGSCLLLMTCLHACLLLATCCCCCGHTQQRPLLPWGEGELERWGGPGGGAHGRWVAQAVNNRKASSSVAQ